MRPSLRMALGILCALSCKAEVALDSGNSSRPRTCRSGPRARSPEARGVGVRGRPRARDLPLRAAPRPGLEAAGLRVPFGNNTCGRPDFSAPPRSPRAGLRGRRAAHPDLRRSGAGGTPRLGNPTLAAGAALRSRESWGSGSLRRPAPRGLSPAPERRPLERRRHLVGARRRRGGRGPAVGAPPRRKCGRAAHVGGSPGRRESRARVPAGWDRLRSRSRTGT